MYGRPVHKLLSSHVFSSHVLSSQGQDRISYLVVPIDPGAVGGLVNNAVQVLALAREGDVEAAIPRRRAT